MTLLICSISGWSIPSVVAIGKAVTQSNEIIEDDSYFNDDQPNVSFVDSLIYFSGKSYIDAEKGLMHIPGWPMELEWDIPITKGIALINKDINKFYNLEEDYPTPLQRSLYLKTPEGEELLSDFNNDYSITKQTEFCILFNLERNSAYDLAMNNFKFKIGINDFNTTSKPGYIGLGNNICISYPTSKLNIKKTLTSMGTDYWLTQYISTPKISEDLAIYIEQSMAKYPCPLSLLFVVKLEGTSKEKRTVNFGGRVGWSTCVDEYLLCKTVAMYIVNTDTGEKVADLSSIFTSSQKKK